MRTGQLPGRERSPGVDAHGRTIDYLRLSVTDRCNERCLYCLPEGSRGWERTTDHLTAAEILRLVRAAVGLGFRKFRLTGGEPLLRGDLVGIVRAMHTLPGVETIGLSTNGNRLAALAQPLRNAGLRTVNVSLDALAPPVYRRITGGDVSTVLAGIQAALQARFARVKLNTVLLRGMNEQELWPLVRFAAGHGLPLRLIELMPVTTPAMLRARHFFPVEEAKRLLAQRDELIAQPSAYLGWGPAKYYRLKHSGALVGFIGPLTTPHFCDTCNKLRLTADGKVRPCLGDHGEVDIRAALRACDPDAAVRDALRDALLHKPAQHRFGPQYVPGRPMTAIGG
jgi:cyclic pyranopterin phosphate synthase